jgi:ATP-dependent Lhr-like helicase
MAGDVFLLGTTSWRILRVESGRVRVEDARGGAPSIPFWRGEAPGRTRELSEEVARLREEVRRAKACPEDCGLERRGSEQLVEYILAGCAALGAAPTTGQLVAERFFDEGGGMQLVIHAPFGARINRAWGLALRKRFCRSFNFELQAAATDNGILISLGEQHSFPLEIVFEFLRSATVKDVLIQAMLPAPMFGARWRWNASRALAIPRYAGGRKVPPPIQRMRADDLMAAVFPDQAACPENLTGDIRIPDHPLVRETIDNCLYEAMDLAGLETVLDAIAEGRIRTVAIDTPEPSPFSHEILNANPYAYLDDAPLEERRARAVQMRRALPSGYADETAQLDPEAIARVAEEAWPLMRDADEFHEALFSLTVLPSEAGERWALFAQLAAAGRAATLGVDGHEFWIAAERVNLVRRVYPAGGVEPQIQPPASARGIPDSPERCAAEILRGWFECSGPLLASALSRDLAMARDLVDQALAQLEAEGQILRGRFTPGSVETEWCHRRLLARIHRLTVGRLRREIEPVTTLQYEAFLERWQHLAPGTQLHGVDGTLQIVRQLQGAEFPAAAWESEVLARRVANYHPDYLDRLCLSGEVSWGRVSPGSGNSRLRPTRAAPLAIFLREDGDWLLAGAEAWATDTLSDAARAVLGVMESRGASFQTDLTRHTGLSASLVDDALWELVTAGLVTADGFENLRALLDPKRRGTHTRHAPGRWALLRHTPAAADGNAEPFARQLLLRWGVVFRDAAAREPVAPAWRDVLVALRRMESRGEIRGGRFVAAFIGEQFASPEALDLLRTVRRAAVALAG